MLQLQLMKNKFHTLFNFHGKLINKNEIGNVKDEKSRNHSKHKEGFIKKNLETSW